MYKGKSYDFLEVKHHFNSLYGSDISYTFLLLSVIADDKNL